MTQLQLKQNHRTTKQGDNLLLYLAILTCLFVIFEVGVVLQFSGFYLGDFKGISTNLDIPLVVLPPVLFFLFAQFSIYALFVLIVWAQAKLIGIVFNSSDQKVETLGIQLWVVNIATLMFANQYYFPNSKFSLLMAMGIHYTVAGFFCYVGFFCLFVISLICLLGAFKKFPRMSKLFLLAIILLSVISKFYPRQTLVKDAATASHPNVVIIGLDAVRPDFLGYFGYEKITPHLDDFLNQSTVFAESLTPLARTFPAWISILTGQYPKTNGIRTDLQNPGDLASTQVTLPNLLKKQGYTALFSTDETRFSNVNQQFGFDQVITPPMGFNDFLLGTFNDFPLSNFVVNTALGRIIFPYSYANRPAYATYDPDSFLALIEPALKQPRSKPLFLSVHLCLAHFPYFWSQIPLSQKSLANYQSALHRVDRQFNDLLALLKKNHILDHAIVIVLSDHGEALELHGDRATYSDLFVTNKSKVVPQFYPPNQEKEEVDQSAGHGTDVLGLTQYHNLLAFKLYGMQKNQATAIAQRVSLLDIKPTILALLGSPNAVGDGHSLLSFITGKGSIKQSSPNDFFVESDFSPISIHTVHPETRDVVFEGINYFHIDPVSAHLQVKDEMRQLIFSSKQYADFYGEWVLALYPQSNKTLQPILVNLKTGAWTNDLHTPFATQSPAQHMLIALRQFYGL